MELKWFDGLLVCSRPELLQRSLLHHQTRRDFTVIRRKVEPGKYHKTGKVTKGTKTESELSGGKNPSRVDILGFSMGGYIAQRLALLRPETVRFVILAGSRAGLGRQLRQPGQKITALTLKRLKYSSAIDQKEWC